MLYCNFAGVPYTGAEAWNELDVVTFLIGDATGEKEVALGTRIQIVRATPSSVFLFVEMEVLIFFQNSNVTVWKLKNVRFSVVSFSRFDDPENVL